MKTLSFLLIGAFAASLGFAQVPPEAMAYLGVASRPADKAVTDVLGLPEGVGLIIELVVDDSAASKAGLKTHDLLHKFDNQMLISPRQLAVLVRSKKPGDKVGIDFLRKGIAQKVDVTLGSTPFTELPKPNQGRQLGLNIEPPKFEMLFDPKGMEDFQKRLQEQMANANEQLEEAQQRLQRQLGGFGGQLGNQLDEAARRMEKDMQQLFDGDGLDGAARELEQALGQLFQGGGGDLNQIFGGAQAKVASSTIENGMKYTYEQENESKSFKVEDLNAGKVLFDGPVNTKKERAKVPEDHMAKLEQMEQNNQVEIGGNAAGGNGNFFFQFGDGFPGFAPFAPFGQAGAPGRPGEKAEAEAEPKVQDGVVSIIEDDITVSISKLDGKTHCKALDRDGKVLFDGPIATKAEQAKIPGEVKDLLEDMNALPRPKAEAKLPEVQGEEEL